MPPPSAAHPLPKASTRWPQCWRGWRDRCLASSRFRRWASGFVLTRPVAHRRARELFDLVAGFVYSQVLLACVRLQLFDRLAAGPQTVAALAAQLGLSESAAERLLAAAAALRLTEPRGAGTYGLGPLGATMVGNTALEAMVEHHAALYADLADPVALLKGKLEGSGGPADAALAGYWHYARADEPARLAAQQVADYSALMTASQPLVADEILDAYRLARHRCLLDVGGGEGTFLMAAAQRAPALRLLLFDLPAVAASAQQRLASAGLADRAQTFGGDFLRDALPRGADVISLVRVVHDHDDAQAMRLLRAAHAALPAGGTLLLAEPMAATPGAEPMGAAYFGFYLLAMGAGRPRTGDELAAMLKTVGFESVRRLKTRQPLQTGLLLAHRGAGATVNPA